MGWVEAKEHGCPAVYWPPTGQTTAAVVPTDHQTRDELMRLARKREEALGRLELLAIALGGMIGGGIFAILGVSVANIGNLTPLAIGLGGGVAFVAAYSYVQLAKLYQDEGATYSFFKRTFPHSHLAASAIGWIVTLGYVSTLALYAFTFGSYLTSAFRFEDPILATRISAGVVLAVFAVINLVSVRGMGRPRNPTGTSPGPSIPPCWWPRSYMF